MNPNVIIACDSTCDLNAELIERYQIKILPLGVTLGNQQYLDGVDVCPDDIYAHYAKTGELPKTSAEELRIAVNGQEVYAAREVWGARSISFRVPAAEEYDLRILTAAWGEKPSGIAGAVKMLVM